MAEPDAAPEVLCIANAMSDLAQLYPWFEETANRHGLPAKLRHAMHVALEEAVMNVATHAYPLNSKEQMSVQLTVDDHHAQLQIEDSGPPFNPLTVPEIPKASTLAELKPGGNGIRLIRHYCKDLAYTRVSGRNQLTMRFQILAD